MSTDENTTKPTIETVLERINSLGEKIDTRMDGLYDRMVLFKGSFGAVEGRLGAVEDRLRALEGEVGEIRNDLRTGLRMVERKIDLLNKNILQVSADQKEMEERVENLESKAS